MTAALSADVLLADSDSKVEEHVNPVMEEEAVAELGGSGVDEMAAGAARDASIADPVRRGPTDPAETRDPCRLSPAGGPGIRPWSVRLS